MRHQFLRLSLLGLASCSLLSSCADFDAGEYTETTAPNGAVVIHGDGPMTPPTNAPRERVVRDFLKSRGAGIAADQLAVSRQIPGKHGITHVLMEQTIEGLRVHGAYAKAAIDSQGQLIQMIDHVARSSGKPTWLKINPAEAIAMAFDELGLGSPGDEIGKVGNKTFFEPGSVFYREPSAERVVYVDENRVLRQGFLVETWVRADNQLELTLIGFDGAVISTESLTSSDSYNVYVEDPLKGPQVVVDGGVGWLSGPQQSTNNISGPNVRAYLDTDANNAPDSGGSSVTDGNFLTAANLSASPSLATNKSVAVQNLFYLNNVAHDVLYAHGFDEAAGNFQGNDPVNAEAQDGGGTDNANFSTPADGSSPRMQMYLWTPLGDHLASSSLGNFPAAGAGFGPALTTTGLTGTIANATPANGCTAISGVAGKLAVIDRGTCDFTAKVMNAQTAGAVGVIIVNNAGDSVFTMGGTNRKIKISSVMVGESSGATLHANAGTSVTIHKNPNPPPMVDGDLDADIVFHEYGHGLTWRMVGGMSGPISGAIGEGASDTNAFYMNGDDRIAEYSTSDSRGLRRFPYAGYPNTYSDFCNDGCQVHNDGEIYAAIQWRIREAGLVASFTNDELFRTWVQGFNFTPASPALENMRDGQLQAAALSGPRAAELTCIIWRGFADGGVGVGAKATLGKGGRTVVVTESFAVPAECQ